MGRRGYGSSTLTSVGYSRSYVRTFGKRQAHKFVCNRCRRTFKPGDQAKQTAFNAWSHLVCPTGFDLPAGWSSKHGDA